MATLEWSTALELNVPVMDETHKEFVDLMAQVEVMAGGLMKIFPALAG